jgi:hypothetical protein
LIVSVRVMTRSDRVAVASSAVTDAANFADMSHAGPATWRRGSLPDTRVKLPSVSIYSASPMLNYTITTLALMYTFHTPLILNYYLNTINT